MRDNGFRDVAADLFILTDDRVGTCGIQIGGGTREIDNRCKHLHFAWTFDVPFGRKSRDTDVSCVAGSDVHILGDQITKIKIFDGFKTTIAEQIHICWFGVSNLHVIHVAKFAAATWIGQPIRSFECPQNICLAMRHGRPIKRITQSPTV